MVVQGLAGDQRLVTLGSVATVAAVGLGAWWYNYQKNAKNRIPTRWIKIAEVEDLFFYPVKSCGPTKLSSVECGQLGFKVGSASDRMFLVVREEDGTLVTGRELPLLTQITTTVEGTVVTLISPDGSSKVSVDFKAITDPPSRILIWQTWTIASDCGDEVARWFSQIILGASTGLRLKYAASETGKTADPRLRKIMKMENKTPNQQDGGRFTDQSSFHLISEASVRDLNSKIKDSGIPPLQFRPNIVIKGEKLLPYEEDVWDWVKIGDVVFQPLGPCTRCTFTTIDPSNGVKSADSEPLRTLSRYRALRDPAKKKITPSPAMGIHMGLRNGNFINKGDAVYIPAI